MGIVLREEPDLVNVDVATVAIVELDQDVVWVEVGADDCAGMEVAHLGAPVDRHPPAPLQLSHRSGPDLQDLDRKRNKQKKI